MSDPREAVEAVFRLEFPRLVAGLTRYVGDVGRAEELAQDALVAALEQWPAEGVPRNAGAWLMTVAKRRAVDAIRRDAVRATKYALVAPTLEHLTTDVEAALDDDEIDDDVLRLLFTACHPVLAQPARVALALRLLGGLTTAEIARAYGQPEATVAQRISRAKAAIAKAGVPFEVPSGPDRAERLGSVLEVVYLIFNEGYTATSGDDWARPELCFEALRLSRVLAALLPDEPEVLGLTALLELQSSRLAARLGPDGEPVLLADQDRHRWDRLLIRRGLEALDRAGALGGRRGRYALQAAIAACHARTFSADETDWFAIATLYGELAHVMPSPVVELNRAVAISMAVGPQAALEVVDALAATGTLDGYHLLPSVRGDLLARLGRVVEARAELERAAAMTTNARERELLTSRARGLGA
ncbi:RNA polymerase sigma factor [Cellulomonas alba]|uniref:RNA polymerase sigma factor n=1 Tax=Cellulomonas alba TaxID=3053467 RepID=A0ABT7SGX4_9CELL|nr:sigma-70 family RNA polymerase sigma factor [Cellulomonas alba]MDM7854774.1 sigma-70 family RNA polymerase sigma factor [Cellulomonas alba]